MTQRKGYIALRRGIIDHVGPGKMDARLFGFFCYCLLHQDGDGLVKLTVEEMAKKLCLSKSTALRLKNRLVDLGYFELLARKRMNQPEQIRIKKAEIWGAVRESGEYHGSYSRKSPEYYEPSRESGEYHEKPSRASPRYGPCVTSVRSVRQESTAENAETLSCTGQTRPVESYRILYNKENGEPSGSTPSKDMEISSREKTVFHAVKDMWFETFREVTGTVPTWTEKNGKNLNLLLEHHTVDELKARIDNFRLHHQTVPATFGADRFVWSAFVSHVDAWAVPPKAKQEKVQRDEYNAVKIPRDEPLSPEELERNKQKVRELMAKMGRGTSRE